MSESEPSTTVGRATVFWDGTAHWWTHDNVVRQGPFEGPDSLDDAIGDARAAGYKIAAVNRTRGTMPAVSPQPLPAAAPQTEVLSGNGNA